MKRMNNDWRNKNHITNKKYISDQIARLIQFKASAEITIDEDGTLGLGEVSTDKLVQGTKTLVFSGGDAQ